MVTKFDNLGSYLGTIHLALVSYRPGAQFKTLNTQKINFPGNGEKINHLQGFLGNVELLCDTKIDSATQY